MLFNLGKYELLIILFAWVFLVFGASGAVWICLRLARAARRGGGAAGRKDSVGSEGQFVRRDTGVRKSEAGEDRTKEGMGRKGEAE